MTDGRTDGASSVPPQKKPRFKGDVGVVSVAMSDVPQKPRFKGDVGVVSAAMQVNEADAESLRAPFPWFGGKRLAAPLVWPRFGDVASYNEPFAGSLAVLLARPHQPRVETVNDLDCFLANLWRAIQADPDGVAFWCDAPVNEADLHSRHRWLVSRGRRLVARCARDPHYFNVKVAGWWVWGQCLWIGSGWCNGGVDWRQPPDLTNGNQVGVASRRLDGGQRTAATRSAENPSEQAKRPHLMTTKGVVRRWQGGGAGGGSGVHAPRLTRQKPLLRGDSGASGCGVHGKHANGASAERIVEWDARPDLSAANGRGGVMVESRGLYEYLGQLAARLRHVRVCCGDWKRVLTPSVTTYIGVTGVFLDPPYRHDMRERCYAEDHDISADVRRWALEHGDDPKMRIALCGYEGEHEMPDTWECVAWKAHGGYSRTERGVANRERERIWFSPHCLKTDLPLFEATA